MISRAAAAERATSEQPRHAPVERRPHAGPAEPAPDRAAEARPDDAGQQARRGQDAGDQQRLEQDMPHRRIGCHGAEDEDPGLRVEGGEDRGLEIGDGPRLPARLTGPGRADAPRQVEQVCRAQGLQQQMDPGSACTTPAMPSPAATVIRPNVTVNAASICGMTARVPEIGGAGGDQDDVRTDLNVTAAAKSTNDKSCSGMAYFPCPSRTIAPPLSSTTGEVHVERPRVTRRLFGHALCNERPSSDCATPVAHRKQERHGSGAAL